MRAHPAPAHSGQAAADAADLAAGVTARSCAARARRLRAEQRSPPAIDSRRSGDQAQQRSSRHALAGSGLADKPRVSPSAMSKLTPSTACTRPRFVSNSTRRSRTESRDALRRARPGSRGAEVGATCRGHRPSVRGSRTSRRPSPTRLKDNDQRKTISPRTWPPTSGRRRSLLGPRSRGCPTRRGPPRRAR